MNQILHIFRKDSRRFWPEILVSLAIMITFVAIVPREWEMTRGLSPEWPPLASLIAALSFLVPLSWWLTMGRVIHAESLVGDNEHWLTRPYEWYKLLAAKLLFCVAYVCVPLLCAQCVLLALAGFHPAAFVVGLLDNLWTITCIFLLPALTVAAVTSTFARMTLTTLGILLGLIGVLLLGLWKGSEGATIPYANDNSGWVVFACFVASCVAALIVQSATRRAWIARLLPLGVGFAAVVLAFMFPTHKDVDGAYPKAAASIPPPLLFQPAPDADHPIAANPADRSGEIQVNIPLQASGVAEGYAVEPNDLQVTIDGPGGLHSVLPWQATYSNKFLPGQNHTEAYFKLSRALFDRIKGSTVRLHLSFALTLFQAGHSTRMRLPLTDVSVPELGYCSVGTTFGGSMLSCRTALRQPPLNYATVPLADGACPGQGETGSPGVVGETWLGVVNPDAAELGISPVKLVQRSFDVQGAAPGDFARHLKLRPCDGRPITFTEYHVAGRARTELTIPQFAVPEESPQNRGVGAVSGISIF